MTKCKRVFFIGVSLGVILVFGCLIHMKYGSAAGQDALGQSDADIMMSETLEGTGYSADFEEKKGIDAKNYYIYTVRDAEGRELSRLAVNATSGEVSAYDEEKNAVEDLSESGKDSGISGKVQIDWDGLFENGDCTVSLLPSDESSFEFTITKNGGAGLTGVARSSGNTAFFSSEGEDITFTMNEDGSLTVSETGSIGAGGTYHRK